MKNMRTFQELRKMIEEEEEKQTQWRTDSYREFLASGNVADRARNYSVSNGQWPPKGSYPDIRVGNNSEYSVSRRYVNGQVIHCYNPVPAHGEVKKPNEKVEDGNKATQTASLQPHHNSAPPPPPPTTKGKLVSEPTHEIGAALKKEAVKVKEEVVQHKATETVLQQHNNSAPPPTSSGADVIRNESIKYGNVEIGATLKKEAVKVKEAALQQHHNSAPPTSTYNESINYVNVAAAANGVARGILRKGPESDRPSYEIVIYHLSYAQRNDRQQYIGCIVDNHYAANQGNGSARIRPSQPPTDGDDQVLPWPGHGWYPTP